MNRILYEHGTEEKYKLELGDILYLNNKRLVICILPSRKIGLMDLGNYLVCNVEYDSLKHLTSYMINKKVENDTIYISSSQEWTVYFP